MLFETDEPEPGAGGRVTLLANDEQIGEGACDHTAPIAFTSYAGMDIGRDNGLVVDRDYEDKAPYPFTGTVKGVMFDLKPATSRRREGAAPGGRSQRGGARRRSVAGDGPNEGRRGGHAIEGADPQASRAQRKPRLPVELSGELPCRAATR